MMTESERKVVVWQFGQIVDCWGHQRQSVRWEMILGAVGEDFCTSHPSGDEEGSSAEERRRETAKV